MPRTGPVEHKSLKGLSPAMAAGVSETLWSMTDLAVMVDGAAPKGIEGEEEIAWRKGFLRKIGYKR